MYPHLVVGLKRKTQQDYQNGILRLIVDFIYGRRLDEYIVGVEHVIRNFGMYKDADFLPFGQVMKRKTVR